GGIQDADVLRQISTAGLGQRGVVLDARLPVDIVASKLTRSTLPDMKVTIPGAGWTWPDTLSGLQPGDEALVYADLPATAAMRVILTGEDRIDVTVPTTTVERPLLERAWVGARIERLTSLRSALPASDSDTREAFRKQIIDLSTRFRVLSDFTALLVLETDGDYDRFGIARGALTDILTVDGTGVAVQTRRSPPPSNGAPTLTPSGVTVEPTAEESLAAAPGLAALQADPIADSPDSPKVAGDADAEDTYGGLLGTPPAAPGGLDGLGFTGTGVHAGGGFSQRSLADTGLIGRGSGTGYGSGAGAGFGGRGGVPMVRQAKPEVVGALDKDIIRRIVRAHINEIRYCYNRGLVRDPRLTGRVAMRFTIAGNGKVPLASVHESTLRDPAVGICITQAVKRWTFPRPEGGGSVNVTYPFVLAPSDGPVANTDPPAPELSPAEARELMRKAQAEARQAEREFAKWLREQADEERRMDAEERQEMADERRAELEAQRRDPLDGEMKEVMDLVKARKLAAALTRAAAWRGRDPGDVLALLALGEVHEAMNHPELAARAYGSIIDLFPSRADLRRYAGARLERTGASALELAIDTFEKAVEQRPDHPASHRLYAFALSRAGRHEEALQAILTGLAAERPTGRFAGVIRVLREDATLIAAARVAADPASAAAVQAQLDPLGLVLASEPSLRFVINWETDANDVDFHVHDGRGGHAYFQERALPSGGELFDDVTTGYGPECYAITGKAKAYPYKLSAHYYDRGPMGYGMGKLQVIEHDGKGNLKFDERPFVIMV
ncbi:MAG TPA: AgmX/PglI C-terminal domain-containing protein, partial [Nannocystis sp.]